VSETTTTPPASTTRTSDPEIEQALMATLRATPRSSEAQAFVGDLLARIEARDRENGQRKRTQAALAGLERAIGAIVGDLLRACRSEVERGMVYRSRHSNGFSGGPFGFDTFQNAVSGLVALGLLEVTEGQDVWKEYDWGDGIKSKSHRGKAARFRATPELVQCAAAAGVPLGNLRHHFHRPLPDREVTLKAASTWEDGIKFKGRLLPFPETPQVETIRAEVRAINQFLDGVRIDGANHDGFHRGFSMGDHPGFSWDRGGRLYSVGQNHFQQISKARRAEITLDGEAVVEIDVRASYLTILHGVAGAYMDVDCDPYEVPGIPREIVKRWLTATLGKGQVVARWPRQLIQGYRDQTGRQLGKDFRATEVARLMTARFPVLNELERLKLSWAELMYLESQAIIGTMTALMNEDVPSLPIHDSVIVPASQAPLATVLLSSAFQKVAGIRPMLTY
jgi:hypothetical protein